MPPNYDDDDYEEEFEPLTSEQQACLDVLKKLAPKGTTIYTITRDVTEGENGGDRWLISLYALGKDFYGENTMFAITHHTCVLLELPLEAQRNTGDRGAVYESTGSDVGNDLVRLLAILAYGHPKAYNQVWL